MGDVARAQALMNEAKAKYDSFGWWSNTKFDDAAELYKKAANIFKLAKEYDKAGDAFLRAADCYVKLNSKHEVAMCYMSAAAILRKSNVPESIKCFKIGIEFYLDEGRFAMAAKHQKEIAELYEADGEIESAMEAYCLAADYFEGDNQVSHSNNCLLKVALFSAQLQQYQRAIDIYQKIAHASIDNNLLKWSVKDYLFRAGLCYLAIGEMIATKRALEQFQTMDHTFGTSRECKLLMELAEAVEESDVEKFKAAVIEFDSISKLEPWKRTIVSRIENKIKEADDDIL